LLAQLTEHRPVIQSENRPPSLDKRANSESAEPHNYQKNVAVAVAAAVVVDAAAVDDDGAVDLSSHRNRGLHRSSARVLKQAHWRLPAAAAAVVVVVVVVVAAVVAGDAAELISAQQPQPRQRSAAVALLFAVHELCPCLRCRRLR